jgi:hypothetical protein
MSDQDSADQKKEKTKRRKESFDAEESPEKIDKETAQGLCGRANGKKFPKKKADAKRRKRSSQSVRIRTLFLGKRGEGAVHAEGFVCSLWEAQE